MTTKDKILQSIRETPKTVTELVQEFGLARTAITTQLDRLLNERLVEKGDMKSAQGAGKPAQVFKVVAGTEDAGTHRQDACRVPAGRQACITPLLLHLGPGKRGPHVPVLPGVVHVALPHGH